MFGTLAPEMHSHQVDFALDRVGSDRHVNIRLAQVSVPFWDLIFENAVIAERVPGQAADRPMVLVSIFSSDELESHQD